MAIHFEIKQTNNKQGKVLEGKHDSIVYINFL